MTNADNVAGAHLLPYDSMRKNPGSVAGKAYFLSQGEPINTRDFMNRLLAAGEQLECVCRSLEVKAEPPITLFLVEQLSCLHWYDIPDARRDFGYEPGISIEEGMRRLNGLFGFI